MNHKILEMLAKAEGREKHVCDATCRYWRFPHLDKACVLSDVFSVRKGELCTEYQAKNDDRCKCQDARTVWNGTLKQWVCDDCGKAES